MNKLDIEVWFKVCINYNAIDSLQNAIYGFQTYFQAKVEKNSARNHIG